MTLLAPFLLGTAAYVTYWIVAGKLFQRTAERALSAAVMTSSHIVTVQVLLGLFHRLTGRNLVVASFIVLALALAIIGNLGWPSWGISSKFTKRGFLHTLAFGAVALSLLGVALLIPPHGWDSLTYHITHIVNYARTGTLELMPLPGRNTFYPQVGEFHLLWVLLLGGRGALFNLNAALIPFAFLGALAVFCCARHLGFERGARAAAWLYLATPLVLIQSVSCYVDVTAAGFFLACLAFLLGYLKGPGKSRAAMVALSLGLLLGTKLSFLYFGLPLLLVMIFGARRDRSFREEEKRVLGHMVPMLLLLIYMGPGFWLTRNLIVSGNPLYPSHIKAAGVTLLEGPREVEHGARQQSWFVESTAGWLRYPFRETAFGGLRYSLENGFGPQFGAGLILWPFALAAAWKSGRRALFWTLFAIPVTVLLWFTVHLYREPRYIVHCCGVTAIVWAWLCSHDRAPVRGAAIGLASVCVAFSLAAALPALHPLQGEMLKRMRGDWLRGADKPGDADRPSGGDQPSVAEQPSGEDRPSGANVRPDGLDRISYFYSEEYGNEAPAWDWLSETTDREGGAVVALNYTELVSPLFGWNLQNSVTHISVGYGPFVNIDPADDYWEWRELLKKKGVRYFYAYTPSWAGDHFPQAQWAREHPEDFRLVKSFGEAVHIYRTIFEGERPKGTHGYPFPVALHLEGLDDSRNWRLVYTEGARATVGQGVGCLSLDWSFDTAANNYFEVLAYVGPTDWLPFTHLRFWVSGWREGDLLFIYLKTPRERDFSRYRISPPAGRSSIEIDIRDVDRASEAFTLGNVTTLHLVVDDFPDGTPGSGLACVGGFQLVSRGREQ